MYNFNEKFRILHFFKFNIWGVISAKVRFTNYYKFTLCNKPIPQKPNTCIEHKGYYAGVFCNFPRYERLSGGPRGIRSWILRSKEQKWGSYASQNPSVTVQKQRTVLFFHCVRFPSYNFVAKTKEAHLTCTSFLFGGPEGNRTPVRKPLDMTFSECSLLFKLPRR